MGKSFFISSPQFGDKDRGITTSGWSLTFLPVLILEFFPIRSINMIIYLKTETGKEYYINELCELYYFQTTGRIAGSLKLLNSAQFNVIYQALELGYDYLESLSEEEREKWMGDRHFHFDSWEGSDAIYLDDDGNKRSKDPKNLIEDLMMLMRDDPRYDQNFRIEDYSIEEIENMPDDPNVKIEDYGVGEEVKEVLGRCYEEAVEVVRK